MTSSPVVGGEMEAVSDFVGRLRRLTGEQLTTIARVSDDARATVAGDIDWWRATAIVSGKLRRLRRSRQAAVASRLASEAVLTSPAAAEVSHDDVVHVARAAGEVARTLVAGGCVSVCASLVPAWLATVDATSLPTRPNAA